MEIVTYSGTVEFTSKNDPKWKKSFKLNEITRKIYKPTDFPSSTIFFELNDHYNKTNTRKKTYGYKATLNYNNEWKGSYTRHSVPEGTTYHDIQQISAGEQDSILQIYATWIEDDYDYLMHVKAKVVKIITVDDEENI